MTTWVWIDGAATPAADARVAALDHGVTVGDGIFETAKVIDRTPVAMRRHLERLGRSAAVMGLRLPWTDEHLRSACAATIAAAGFDEQNSVCRIRRETVGQYAPRGAGTDDDEVVFHAGQDTTVVHCRIGRA